MKLKTIIDVLAKLNIEIDSDLFNELLASMQEIIGVESGDVAGVYFSSHGDWVMYTETARRHVLTSYVSREVCEVSV